jgi:SAM-dependent methyltransferase/uncharacterized protein YbaR (Trm112 family)
LFEWKVVRNRSTISAIMNSYIPYVCPRDKQPLQTIGRELICASGHKYPVVRGIPVLLLDEAEQTHECMGQSIARAKGEQPQPEDDWEPSPEHYVHYGVQLIVAAAGGAMYQSLRGKLRDYPIPDIRLACSAGQQLLDIGCMWGRWTISAARKGYLVTGIDPDLGCILTARKVARQLGIEARFIVADARYLPFPEGSFQGAFSYSVLQHFSKEDARLTIQEIGRILAADGKALIQLPNKFGIRSFYHQIRQMHASSMFQVRYWSPKELLRTFNGLIGPSELSVDGFFGLGIQPSDIKIIPWHLKPIIIASETMRKLSHAVPPLTNLADSLYVTSTRA